jgi:uncharacterized membrane protein
VLALAALVVAAFLTWERARGAVAPCPIAAGGCETVARSSYATLGSIPVSALGVVGAVTLLLACGWRHVWAPSTRLAVAGAGAVFSIYLTWLEAERIHAYCAWCLASAVIWTLAAAVAAADAATT